MEQYLRLLFTLFSFVLILVLAYLTTKFIAKRSNSFTRGKNIEIIEHFSFSNNIKMIIVKVYQSVYILSINNNNTTVIDKLDYNDVQKMSENTNINTSNKFQPYLDRIFNKNNEEDDYNEYFDEEISSQKLLKLKKNAKLFKNKSQSRNYTDKDENYEKDY